MKSWRFVSLMFWVGMRGARQIEKETDLPTSSRKSPVPSEPKHAPEAFRQVLMFEASRPLPVPLHPLEVHSLQSPQTEVTGRELQTIRSAGRCCNPPKHVPPEKQPSPLQ
ncbi:uncharacterized protein B0T23DRAFT_106797 [Neurospora hispaniola]|uniref:Uncharacterized protein n=1 Tax=Neurospora hispaniola TaxID=588809 RepID=A0AAJ0MS49_9PEZI|nr:hypothetical protein B0T23DRAFT_106797 [Neurospora hispaniola]